MIKLIFIGSLKYSPIYKSHSIAFGKACESLGYDIKYIFSNEYKWLLDDDIIKKTYFVGSSNNIQYMVYDTLNVKNSLFLKDVFLKEKPSHVYIQNYHFLNHFILNLCKKNGSKFIYHVHEPYVINKKAHGGVWQYWLYLSEFMDKLLVNNTDIAIVSSKEASRLFDKQYPNFKGSKMEIPLMYEDLGENYNDTEREYITFIGPPVPNKGPKILLKIIDYSNDKNYNLKFLITSRSKVDPIFNKQNVTIFYKNKISDKEFGDVIKQSRMVIAPFIRETQSSGILVSYMYGTPVVSSNVGGLPEFVNHGKTGYLVNVNAPVEDWIEKINYVMNDFSRMTVNCRNYFVENFSGKNWKKYLKDLLN